MKFGLWRVNLAVTTEVLTSRGMDPSLTVRLTSLRVQDMCAPLSVKYVTISFRSTVWRTPKVSRITGISYGTSWSIQRIGPWMIFGTDRFFHDFPTQNSVRSVGSYICIAPLTAFCVAYGFNQFLGIAYGINLFV